MFLKKTFDKDDRWLNILSKKLKILAGGFDENGNPLYLIKDTTDMNRDMIGDYEICKKVIEQQSTIEEQNKEIITIKAKDIKFLTEQ